MATQSNNNTAKDSTRAMKAYKRTCPTCGANEREYIRRVKVFCGLCWDKHGEDKAPAMVYEYIRMVDVPIALVGK